MTKLSHRYVRVRQIALNQLRIFRKDGVRGNIASLGRVRDNRGITGTFATGLRVRISAPAITRWHQWSKQHIVVVAPPRADLAAWLRDLPSSVRLTLVVEPGRLEVFGSDARHRVKEGPSHRDLRGIRRFVIQNYSLSDVLILEEFGDLPTASDLMAMNYAAHRYEIIDGRVGAVTPQLVDAASGKAVNGFEWDRREHVWVSSAVRGEDLGQGAVPRDVLSAPMHGLYLRGAMLRRATVGDAALADQVHDLLRNGWREGWRTLAFPLVSLVVPTVVAREPSDADRAWLTGRRVTDDQGRLRVIYVLLATTISGGIRTVFEQTEHLLDLGHDVQIWSLQGPPDWTSSRTPIVTFDNYRDLTAALAGEHAIKVATWWETAQVVWLSAVNNGVAFYYVQEFETWFYPDDAVARAAVAASYRLEMDHVAIAQYQADELARIGVPATVVSSAYDHEKFHPTGAQRSSSTVMAVGRTFFQKNFAMTLAAWRSFAAPRPGLLLYGFEPEVARDAGIEYVVKPTDAGVNDLYNRATVFVQTSRHEGFCLPVLEAMAAGCPVITTDSHGNRDFCVDDVNCVMVEQDDAEGLASAIRRVLADGALQDRLRAAGVATARDYTWQVVARKLEEHFLSLA